MHSFGINCIYQGCNGSQYSQFGSVRYDTVVSRVSTFSIRGGGGGGNWLRLNVGNISVLNHEGEPMNITHVQTL